MAAGAKYLCFTEIKPDISSDSVVEDIACDNIPEPRSGHRIVVDHGNLYSIGGYNPDFSERENDNDTYYPLFKVLICFFLYHINVSVHDIFCCISDSNNSLSASDI